MPKMKRLKLLMALMTISLIAFSQPKTLKPLKIEKDGEQYRCFDNEQSKYLAKTIIAKEYCDSTQDVSSQVIATQDSIIKAQRNQNTILRAVIDNTNMQLTALSTINDTLKSDAKEAQREAKKQKTQKIIAIIIGGILGIVAIVN